MSLEKYADLAAFVPTPDGKHPNLWDSRTFLDTETGEETIISGNAKEVYGYIYDACQSRYDNPNSKQNYPFESTWLKDSHTKIGKYLDIERHALGKLLEELLQAGVIQRCEGKGSKKRYYYRPSSRKEYLGNGRGYPIVRDMLIKPKNEKERLPTDQYHYKHFIEWSQEYNESHPRPKFERKRDTTQDTVDTQEDLQETTIDLPDDWDDFENIPF